MSLVYFFVFVFFFKQKTAYEMRISDWSSDVCSSDLLWYLSRQTGPEPLSPYSAVCLNLAADHRAVEALFEEFKKASGADRSEERRVGKECVSTGSSRWSPYH